MKQHIVLLIYHGMGHFNACLNLAEILREHYEVTFVGYIYFKNYVEGQGFKFHPLKTVPFGLGFEKWVNTLEQKKNVTWHVITDRWSNRLYHAREKELSEMLEILKPSHILIDGWQSTDFIALYPFIKGKNIRIGFIQTMLPTIITPLMPPLTSQLLPGNKKKLKSAVNQLLWSQWKKKIIDKIKYLGRDNDAIIQASIRANKIPQEYISKHKSIFSVPFKKIPELILAPFEFEFKNTKPLPDQCYIGSLVDTERDETISKEYKKISLEIDSKLHNHQLIYCSFGSTDLEDITEIKKYIEHLANVVIKLNLMCIISSGNKMLANHISERNVYFLEHAPQLKLLKQAALFITHGGLNSIKEAIDIEVPMLVCPVTNDSDMNGNAARVLYHKMGLIGNISSDAEADLEEKIKALLKNDSYRTAIKKFKSNNKAYSEGELFELIDKISTIK